MNGSAAPGAGASFLAAVLDLLYPPRCAACRALLESSAEEPFCEVCREAIDPVPAGCARCGAPGPDPVCGGCLAAPPAFASCRAGGLFGGPLADAVHALKYGDRPALARPLGAWLAGRAGEAWPAGASVVGVPLGRRRRLARGYDQADLLARAVARAAGAPFLAGAVRRARETAPQVGKSRAERLRNVRGAFLADRRRVRGKDLLLVDDVVTTGATADACAQGLLSAGARSVHVLGLARAAD